MENMKFIRCDRCGRPIIKGGECINDKMKAGIYCSVLCWAYDNGDFKKNTLNEEIAENCYTKLIESNVPEGTRRYSNTVICDANEDEEMEYIADTFGYSYSSYQGFKKTLDNSFSPQLAKDERNSKALDFVEWVSAKTLPNHSVDFNAGVLVCTLAYEFANGFMVFQTEEPI